MGRTVVHGLRRAFSRPPTSEIMMLIRKPDAIQSSEITPERVWRARRDLILGAGVAAAGLGLPGWASRAWAANAPVGEPAVLRAGKSLSVMDKQTSLSDITSYNNYYEFGLDKSDPAAHAGKLQTRPWTVSVEGEVGKPRTFDIEELLKLAPMEERVYRLRCVEGWSMVIPWVGYSLSALLKQVEPTANAKYVEFVTVMQRDNMPGVRAGCWTGHMWKACASTKPCTRWPCWCSACTARSCPIRTGRLCGWRCRGSTASNRPNRWSRSGWSKSSRCLPGSRPRRRSMASTPM